MDKYPKHHISPFSCYLARSLSGNLLRYAADRLKKKSENITFYPCRVKPFKYLCLPSDVANENAAFALIVGPVIAALIHLWWQLLQLSCHPSFYSLLCVCAGTLRDELDVIYGGGRADPDLALSSMQSWECVLCDDYVAVWVCLHFFTYGGHYCTNEVL